MKYKVRQTAIGTEYWDTQEKRTVFVKHGIEPNFEVVPEPDNYAGAVAKEQELLGKAKTPESKKLVETPEGKQEFETPELGTMTIQQLQGHANEAGIEIPKDITKRQEIIDYLSEQQIEDTTKDKQGTKE